MKRFWYKIENDEIDAFVAEVENIPSGFIELKTGLGSATVYYKIENGKITDAISEAMHEEAAHRRVEELISALNINLV